jgi:hypothetical protein
MAHVADAARVAESCTTTSGDLTLTGAFRTSGMSGDDNRTFASAMSVNDTCEGIVVNSDGAWQREIFTLSASTTLQRTTFIESSTGSNVTFGAGNKVVYLIATEAARTIDKATGKTTPVGADKLGIWDSVTGFLNGLTLTNLAAFLASLTQTLSNKTLTTPVINGATGSTAAWNFGSGQFTKDTSGNVALSGTLTCVSYNLITNASGSPTTILQSDQAAGSAPSQFVMRRRGVAGSAKTPDSSLIGQVIFDGMDAAGTPVYASFGSIDVSIGTNAAGGAPATMNFSVSASGGAAINRLILAPTELKPAADNSQTLGSAALRWSTVFAGTGAINTSDARAKTPVLEMTASEIGAAKAMARELGTFKFLSAIDEKGAAARIHTGMTVQRAMEVMQENGLDPLEYAFICHDTWEAVAPVAAIERVEPVPAVDAVLDEAGNEVTPAVAAIAEVLGRPAQPGREAGDAYGFRADELHAFILRGLLANQDALEARLAALESAP